MKLHFISIWIIILALFAILALSGLYLDEAWSVGLLPWSYPLTLLVLAVVFCGFASYILLVHAHEGDAAPGAKDTWIKGLDILVKCLGGGLLVGIVAWYGHFTGKQADAQRKADEAARETLARVELDAARYRDNTNRVDLLLRHLASGNPIAQQAAIAVAGGLLQEKSQGALSLFQALYVVSRCDDAKLRDTARAFLPPLAPTADPYDFAAALLGSKATLSTLKDPTKIERALDALQMVQEHAGDKASSTQAGEIIVGFGQASIAAVPLDATEKSSVVQNLAPALAAATINAATDAEKSRATQLVTSLSSGALESAVDSLPAATAQKVADKLVVSAEKNPDESAAAVVEKLPGAFVELAIAKLDASAAGKLAPRVYLHIANESQRHQVTLAREALRKKDFLVPGIQNISSRGYVPDTLEVRFFDNTEVTRQKAKAILDVIKAAGARDGRISYVIPSASDRKVSNDIASHFEVWAGRESYAP